MMKRRELLTGLAAASLVAAAPHRTAPWPGCGGVRVGGCAAAIIELQTDDELARKTR